MSSLDQRRERYVRLSRIAAQLDDADFRALLAKEEGRSLLGGRTHEVQLGGCPVFVKRVLVTDVEYAHRFSTKNLYRLPICYHYGVGSAGFGVFRELLTLLKTTRWVLGGEVSGIPLLYHYRLIPAWGGRFDAGEGEFERHASSWGDHPSINQFMRDRGASSRELVLLLEQFPETLAEWLPRHSEETSRVLTELRATLDFLRRHGVLHLDAHFRNVVTDGGHVYLTDFGLALDRAFALDEAERDFFARHQFYDYGVMLWSLLPVVLAAWKALPDTETRRWREAHGVRQGLPDHEVAWILLDHIQQLHRDGVLELDRACVESVIRYRAVILVMGRFLTDMMASPTKDTAFPETELVRALTDSGMALD